MNYTSAPNSIAFWEFMEQRVQAAIKSKKGVLISVLEPVASTIDTMAKDFETTAHRRKQTDIHLGELQRLETLLYYMQGQLANQKIAVGLHHLDLQISVLNSYIELLSSVLTRVADRDACEAELKHYLEQHDRLKSAGNTETAIADRQRLRSYSVVVPVFGYGDVASYSAEEQRLRTQVDSLKIQRQQLLVGQAFSLVLTDDVAGVMAQFGVAMQAIEPPAVAPQEPAQKAQPADAPAPAEQGA